MAKRGHTDEEILRVLLEAWFVSTVVEVCRKHGISQQSFYPWKRKYAGPDKLRELRQLREETASRSKLNFSNYLGNIDLKPSLPLAYVGIVSGQAAEGTRVKTRILKALKVNKAAQQVNCERQRARFVAPFTRSQIPESAEFPVLLGPARLIVDLHVTAFSWHTHRDPSAELPPT